MPVDYRPAPRLAAPDVVVALPPVLRAVLLEWCEPCDPALACLAMDDATWMRGRLVQLALAMGPCRADCIDLLLLYKLARLNQQFGLVAPLRQQGALVCAWVAAAVSASVQPAA